MNLKTNFICMSRINNFVLRFSLFSCIVAIAVSCSKDDNASSVFVFNQTTYVFETGQTQRAVFSKSHVGKIEITEITDGWTATVGSSAVTMTAPTVIKDNNKTGTIELKAHGNTIITVTLKVSIEAAADLSADGIANCYIAPLKNTRYKFRATAKGNDASQALYPAGAKLVWQSAKNLINYIAYDNGYIMFSTSATDSYGNGVIAAVDENDDILWSWHVWFADYQPVQTAQTYSNGLVFMDRNLGAYGCDTSSVNEMWKSYGLLYQWGRKDPFVGSRGYNTDVDQYTYDDLNRWQAFKIEETTQQKGVIEYTVSNPRVFLTGVKASDYDWLYNERDNTLWGGDIAGAGGSKSIYDPCPYGWRVPPQNAWSGFTKTGGQSEDISQFNVDGGYRNGWMYRYDGMSTTYYPAAGRRSFSAGVYTNVDAQGYEPVGLYWTDSAPASNSQKAAALDFTKNMINPVGGLYRAGGHSIRCVKEADE